jgi:hypothetical protein
MLVEGFVKSINFGVLLCSLATGLQGVSYGSGHQNGFSLKKAEKEIHKSIRYETMHYREELLDRADRTLSKGELEKLKLVIKDHLIELYHKSAALIKCEQGNVARVVVGKIGCWGEKKFLRYEVSSFKKQLNEYMEQVIRERKRRNYLTVGGFNSSSWSCCCRIEKAVG